MPMALRTDIWAYFLRMARYVALSLILLWDALLISL